MEYRKFNDTYVVRLDPGEEILTQMTALAAKENIRLAEVSGLGAVNEITTGVYDTVNKVYHSNSFSGAYEITSLTGTITRKDGDVYLHFHLSAGDKDGKVIGGHLNKAVVSATAEIIVREIPGEVGRKLSDAIGLNLFVFGD